MLSVLSVFPVFLGEPKEENLGGGLSDKTVLLLILQQYKLACKPNGWYIPHFETRRLLRLGRELPRSYNITPVNKKRSPTCATPLA